jgi:hypothetical protein
MLVELQPTSPLLSARCQKCRQFLETGVGIMCRADCWKSCILLLDGWATYSSEMVVDLSDVGR